MLEIECLPSCSSLDKANSLVLRRLEDLESRGLSPRFRRYLEHHLCRIIKSRWPLDHRMVREFLVNRDFEFFENKLKRLEEVVGEEDLGRMFGELKTSKSRPLAPPHFHSKLESFHAEADCAIFLHKVGAQDIKHLSCHGDWEFRLSGKTLRVEVKNVQAHDFHLECIKEALFGEMSLVSSALRNYRSVFIQATDVSERFRNSVIGIVHEHLPSLLARPEVDGTEVSITTIDGIKIVCCWFVPVDGAEAAEVEISTPCGDRCSIEFKRSMDFPDLVSASIQSSDDFWWGDPKPDWDEVSRKIRNSVSKALNQLKNFSAPLIFIRLNLHPMFQDNVRMQKERLAEALGPSLALTNQPLVIEIPLDFDEDRFQLVFNEAARDFEKLWAHFTKQRAL